MYVFTFGNGVKMAYILKRKGKKGFTYRVQVQRVGFKSIFKTLDTLSEAKRWGRQMESKLDRGDYSDYSEASKVTLGDLFKRYVSEGKHKKQKQWRNTEYRLGLILKDTISDINLLRFSTKHLSEYRDRRLQHVTPDTFNKDFNFISVVIQTAQKDWGIYIPQNPCRLTKREKTAPPRNRILVNEEESRLLKACELSSTRYLKPMVEFSIETAIRQGELLKLRYEHFDRRRMTIYIPETKNGEPRTIPLSKKAIGIIESLPRRLDGKIFPLTKDVLGKRWYVALKKAKISNFRWHDLRRTGVSMWFERGLSVPSVQVMSGHKDPRVLLNTYTKLNPEKIAKEINKEAL